MSVYEDEFSDPLRFFRAYLSYVGSLIEDLMDYRVPFQRRLAVANRVIPIVQAMILKNAAVLLKYRIYDVINSNLRIFDLEEYDTSSIESCISSRAKYNYFTSEASRCLLEWVMGCISRYSSRSLVSWFKSLAVVLSSLAGFLSTISYRDILELIYEEDVEAISERARSISRRILGGGGRSR